MRMLSVAGGRVQLGRATVWVALLLRASWHHVDCAILCRVTLACPGAWPVSRCVTVPAGCTYVRGWAPRESLANGVTLTCEISLHMRLLLLSSTNATSATPWRCYLVVLCSYRDLDLGD